jgi:hypothetical protein
MPPAALFIFGGNANGAPSFDQARVFTDPAADALVNVDEGPPQVNGYPKPLPGLGGERQVEFWARVIVWLVLIFMG